MLGSINKKRKPEWLLAFIKNSQHVIANGDIYALRLYNAYQHQVMPSFSKELSDHDIYDVLSYLERETLFPKQIPDINNSVIVSARAEVVEGMQLFDQQCASCHSVVKENYGPALGSVTKRHSREWLIAFIKNSQKVIRSGDEYAIMLFNNFDKKVMVPMEFLSDGEINSILQYIEFASSSENPDAGVNGRKSITSFRKTSVVAPHMESPEKKHFFKGIFIFVAVAAALVHVILIVKLFRYLQG
jgi:mono/diheme cytochrome c family protein